MLSAFFQRSALHLLLYDMTAQIVPPCSTLPLSAALFGCFPSPQMQGAEGCSLSFQKIAGSTTRHPEEASAFPDILQHTKTAPASCFGNRGGSFALWFFICAFQALARSLAASGSHTIAGMEVFALGRYNKKAEDVALVVGNGWGNDSHEYRSDALTLDYSGNLHISGKLTADGGVGYVLPSATADTLGGVMIGDNINVSDSGTISVNLSAYLKADEISDWAKAESKPVYTAEEVGAAEKNHTHNMSDITDIPEWTKTENKPAYTASEVGAATAADITAAVNAVEIGGRNLLYDSTGNIKNGWSGTTVINVGGGISGNSLAISRTGYSGNARYFGISKRHFLTDFNVGTSYTLSAWIKVRSDVGLDASGYVMARFRSADDKKLYALSLTVGVDTVKDKWLYYEKTWTINDSDIAKLECVALALDKNGMIEACNIKLEKGTKATDWSPAVEENTERIASLEARVAALEAMAVSGGEV